MDTNKQVIGLFYAILKGEENLQQQLYSELDDRLLLSGAFSTEMFDVLQKVISEPSYQASTDSAWLLKVFEFNMELLEARQKKMLLALFEKVYKDFLEPAACMLIVEMIADHFPTDRSLHILLTFSTISADVPRSIAAYGLGYLARKTHDRDVFMQSRTKLSDMACDASENVSIEAQAALAKLPDNGEQA